MDAFRLLSRSTKFRQGALSRDAQCIPSSGQKDLGDVAEREQDTNSRKRKRGHNQTVAEEAGDGHDPDFFGHEGALVPKFSKDPSEISPSEDLDATHTSSSQRNFTTAISLEDRKRLLKSNKLKITWLNSSAISKKKRKHKDSRETARNEHVQLFPTPLQNFNELKASFGVSNTLARNVTQQGFTCPSEVQLGSLPLLLGDTKQYMPLSGKEATITTESAAEIDLLTVAPTGSGKTLAFLIPLVSCIQRSRPQHAERNRTTRAIILVPTKELAAQVVNEGKRLVKGISVSITKFRKGMRLVDESSNSETHTSTQGNENSALTVKSDILVSTPGLLRGIIADEPLSKSRLSQIHHLVLDEADVLLDPVFREQTLYIWNHLDNPTLRVSLWSATMGSNIEQLSQATIDQRRLRLAENSKEAIQAAPLLRLVVGLKDTAVANVQHKLIYAATEQGKLMGLRQLLHPTTSSNEAGRSLTPPFLVFTQTVERAIALHSELLYDIPPEAGGVDRIAVLHSNLSDTSRDNVMTRFRKGGIWVLITTDLLSRGIDFRGINGVVNYDLPTSSAAYVHRVGRTGRAGREGGVAVTLYSKEDVQYLKHVVNVVSMAERQQQGSQSGMQQWLLEALPKLRKKDKQDLKRHGVASRSGFSRHGDTKSTTKSRISTKAGYVRRAENKRRGAIRGSKSRTAAAAAEAYPDDHTDFVDFD